MTWPNEPGNGMSFPPNTSAATPSSKWKSELFSVANTAETHMWLPTFRSNLLLVASGQKCSHHHARRSNRWTVASVTGRVIYRRGLEADTSVFIHRHESWQPTGTGATAPSKTSGWHTARSNYEVRKSAAEKRNKFNPVARLTYRNRLTEDNRSAFDTETS